jgi:formylmethanofuran dehydrogenase subunit E
MDVSRRLTFLLPAMLLAHEDDANPALDRTSMIHGGAGPFAVAGYRMGEAALKKLNTRRGSFDLEVIHYAPPEVQWSCIIDGLQAATGTSLGKLNLKLVEAPRTGVHSVVRNRKTGETVKLTLSPSFLKDFLNVPPKQLAEAGFQVTKLPDEKIFDID